MVGHRQPVVALDGIDDGLKIHCSGRDFFEYDSIFDGKTVN